ncbi:MAG: hypothetical protein GF398_05175 [Chitinivibrionales bacterium]|nr:hypothetical protein [Chitinivibrionales bacterium]
MVKHLFPFIALIAAVTNLCAENIAIFPVYVTNLSRKEGDAIGAVMKQEYGKHAEKHVIGPRESQAALEEHANDFTSAAKSLQAAEYIELHAVALSEKILIEGVRMNQDGRIIHRTQMTAVTLDDLPDVCNRMAQSLINKTAHRKHIDLDNVTTIETRGQNRLFTETVSGVKIAMFYVHNKKKDFHDLLNIGYDMKLDSRNFFMEFAAGALFPADMTSVFNSGTYSYGGVQFEVGGAYYLQSHAYVSPYLGGGVSPRILFEPGGVTVAPYLQLGVMFMRVASTKFYFDIKVAQNAFPVKFGGSEEEYYNSNSGTWEYSKEPERSYYPTEVGLQLGIGW